MMNLFTTIEVDEDTPVTYVGVYTMKWRPEWGQPTVMFAPVDDPIYDAAPELLEACKTARLVVGRCIRHYEREVKRNPPVWLIDAENDLIVAIAKAEGGAE